MNKTCENCIHCDCCDYWEEEVYTVDEYDRHICSKFNNKDNYQKVIHAKWTNGCYAPTYTPKNGEESGLQTAYCTNCNITQTVNTYQGKVQFKFCPYCGAKMDL